MTIYTQHDPAWENLPLGDGVYHMGVPGVGFGCTTVCAAQLLTLAGWNLTPGDVNNGLNASGGYTVRGYQPAWPDGGSGLILWRHPGLEQAFPQFHFNDGGPYHFWVGSLGAYQHWISEKDGVFYDSISGQSTTDINHLTTLCGIRNVHLVYSCSIDAAPAEVAVHSFPKDVAITARDGNGHAANLNVRDKATGGKALRHLLHGDIVTVTDKENGDTVIVGSTTSNLWLQIAGGWISAAGTNYTSN